jgi:hypothetical protein
VSKAALEGGKCFLERAGEAWQVPVVDDAAVELEAQLFEEADPVVVLRCRKNRFHWRGDHDPLDDLEGGATRGSRAGLLPGPVPTGRRAPLRDRTPRPKGDRPAAPPTCHRCSPSSASRRGVRGRCIGRLIPRIGCRSPWLPASPTFALAAPSAVLAASLAAHGPSVRGDVRQPVTTNCRSP